MDQKPPAIIMIVSPGGVSVMTANCEDLKSEEQLGFDILAGKVHDFAAELVDYATKRQKANQGKVH